MRNYLQYSMLVLKQKAWLLLKPNKQPAAGESIMINMLSLLQNMQQEFLTSYSALHLDNAMFPPLLCSGKTVKLKLDDNENNKNGVKFIPRLILHVLMCHMEEECRPLH